MPRFPSPLAQLSPSLIHPRLIRLLLNNLNNYLLLPPQHLLPRRPRPPHQPVPHPLLLLLPLLLRQLLVPLFFLPFFQLFIACFLLVIVLYQHFRRVRSERKYDDERASRFDDCREAFVLG